MALNDLFANLEKDAYYIDKFCSKYGVRVVDVRYDNEDFLAKGSLYLFDDNLGGYTIEGIKNSLEPQDTKLKDDIQNLIRYKDLTQKGVLVIELAEDRSEKISEGE